MEGKAFQDMPPPGGFGSINVNRVPPRPMVKQAYLFLAMAGLSAFGLYYCRDWRRRYFASFIEENEHYIACTPFIDAERERAFLYHLHDLRDDEAKLMKDVPGWKLGTLYGEKVYKTLPPDTIPPVSFTEYTAHRGEWEIKSKVVFPDIHQ